MVGTLVSHQYLLRMAAAGLSLEEEFELHVRVCEARELRNVVHHTLARLDPFAYVRGRDEMIRSTSVKEGHTSPIFDWKT